MFIYGVWTAGWHWIEYYLCLLFRLEGKSRYVRVEEREMQLALAIGMVDRSFQCCHCRLMMGFIALVSRFPNWRMTDGMCFGSCFTFLIIPNPTKIPKVEKIFCRESFLCLLNPFFTYRTVARKAFSILFFLSLILSFLYLLDFMQKESSCPKRRNKASF